MSGRISLALIILFTVAVVGGVTYYFALEFQAAKQREEILGDLSHVAKEEGACAALAKIRAIADPLDESMRRAIESQRLRYATEVVGSEDTKARNAFLAGDADRVIDRALCEQILLVRDLGEMHPVLALLRLTREKGDPCDAAFALSEVLAGLSSHRTLMLQALMEDPSRLKCLSASAVQQIAGMVAQWVRESPRALDELDVLRVASFLDTWNPIGAAQLGCWLEAQSSSSRLANAIGCTPDHRNRVLVRYRYPERLPGQGDAPPVEAGGEVFLLGRRDDRCDVRPTVDPPRLYTVGCSDLVLISDVDVAVLVEPIVYGLVRADLIAGVVHYTAGENKLSPAREEPKLGSWFAYDHSGSQVGMSEVVTLADLAQRFGEELPPNPLRAFCRANGAKYCYDVDWAQVVTKLDGEPVVFLSRPLGVFVAQLDAPPDVQNQLFREAFGRPAAEGATMRVYTMGRGGYLIVEGRPAAVEVRWRVKSDEPWKAQGFGTPEGGTTPPSARLLAVLDLEADGRPEILVQRANRALQDGEVKDVSDEIIFMRLDTAAAKFSSVNQLTVREY